MESRLPLDQRLSGRVKRPREVLAWSEGPEKEMYFDDRALRYLYLPLPHLDRTPHINLARGFDATKFDPDANLSVYLDNVLTAVTHHEKETGERLEANVFTWRGLLTRLIQLSQGRADRRALDESFENFVVGFDGQIFMTQDSAATASNQSWKSDPAMKRFMYTGFQFEHVATLQKPWGETSRDEIENRYTTGYLSEEKSSYGILVRSGIGAVDLIYGAETDCVKGYKSKENKLANYVELKTTRVIENEGQAAAFERKLFTTWVQSFLSGVPRVMYGFRDNNLELQTVEEFRTDEITKFIKNSRVTPPDRRWNGNDAISFYTVLMQWIKDTVRDGHTYKLSYTARTRELVLRETPVEIPGREVAFLSNEFVQWRRSRKENGE